MKTNVNILLTAAAFCLAAWSCSGEDGTPLPPAPETPEQPIDPDALCTIIPGSIAIAPVDMSQTPLTRSATGEPEQKATYSENLGHNSSIEATLEAMPQGAQTRAMVPLVNGVWYHVVAIDNTGAIADQAIYKVGSDTPFAYGPLELKAGTYRLFCYSKNRAEDIFTWDEEGKTIFVGYGDDFMTYTVPNFTISADDCLNGKTLDIKFVRQCAKLTVTIKSDGYSPGNITNAKADLRGDIFNDATWSIFNSDNSILTPPIGVGSNMMQPPGSSGSSIDCGISDLPYALVAPFSNKTLKIEVGKAYIDGAEKEFPNNISFPNLTLVKGGSYRLTITMGNYYVLTNSNPVVIYGQKWARTNLYQKSDKSVDFVTNPQDHGSLWNWGIRDATSYGWNTYLSGADAKWIEKTNNHTNQDPCRALPGGRWRLPNKADCESLLLHSIAPYGSKVKIGNIVNTINNSTGWAPNSACVVFRKDNVVLCMPAARDRDTDGTPTYPNSLYGGYHSSTTSAVDALSNPFVIEFDATYTLVTNFNSNRAIGQSIRCVYD